MMMGRDKPTHISNYNILGSSNVKHTHTQSLKQNGKKVLSFP